MSPRLPETRPSPGVWSRRRLFLVWALLSAAVAAHAYYFNYTADDAYITFRYVRNMLGGHGLVFNPGERVEGYTNFLWAVFLAVPARLGLSFEMAARALGLLFSSATLGLTLIIGGSLRPGNGFAASPNVLRILPAALLAANGAFALWTLGGLETSLFAFLLCLLVWVQLRSQERFAPLATGTILALLALTRPDGLVFLAATMLYKILQRRGPLRQVSLVFPWKELATIAGTFLLLFLPYYLWRYHYYGYPLPNTFYAKVGTGTSEFFRGGKYLGRFLLVYGVVPLLAAAAAIGPTPRRRLPAGERGGSARIDGRYLGVLLAAYVAFILLVGGDFLVMFRFFAPLLPIIYLLSMLGFARLPIFQGGSGGSTARSAVRYQTMTAFGLLLLSVLVLLPSFVSHEQSRVLGSERPAEADRRLIGSWLRANAPASTTVALIPAGIVPFFSGLTTIDLLGLNDVTIAHTTVTNFGTGQAGHEKHNSRYVLDRHPDLIFLGACRIWPQEMTVAQLVGYYGFYSRLVPGNREMLETPDLREHYVACAAQIAGGFVHFLKRNEFNLPSTRVLGTLPVLNRESNPTP